MGGQKSGSFPYWNNWYSSYEEAKNHMKHNSDYLIPFENHFFVCGSDYIEALGITEDDPDLKLVGRDWFQPANQLAFERLMTKIKETK